MKPRRGERGWQADPRGDHWRSNAGGGEPFGDARTGTAWQATPQSARAGLPAATPPTPTPAKRGEAEEARPPPPPAPGIRQSSAVAMALLWILQLII